MSTTPKNTPKFAPWRLRLKNGVISASDGDLDGAVSWLEASEIVFGVAVFLGVALEVVIASVNPPYDSPLERWGPVFADGLVALGVLGEIIASARITLCQGEMTRRSNLRLEEATRQSNSALGLAASAQQDAADAQSQLAEAQSELASALGMAASANERAAKLELQAAEARERASKIERIVAWRAVTAKEQEELKELVGPQAHLVDLYIEYQSQDPEAYMYAWHIAEAFQKVGVANVRRPVGNSFPFQPMFGVHCASDEPDVQWGMLSAFPSKMAAFSPGPIALFRQTGNPPANTYIFVGPKMPGAPIEEDE